MSLAKFLFSAAVLCICLIANSCGSSSTPQLQSIMITPNSADAPSGGSVQFLATGVYSDGSQKPLPASSVSWCASANPGVCIGNSEKPGVTVSGSGLAQCQGASVGLWSINANSPPTSESSQPGGEIGAPIIFGSGILTCP
jgi:hypothetical protein